MKSTDDRICTLTTSLTHIRKEKIKLMARLAELNEEEKDVAFQLNSALGIVPLQEAADRVKRVIERANRLSSHAKSEAMRRLWASKTPEERAAWKLKLGRKKKEGLNDNNV